MIDIQYFRFIVISLCSNFGIFDTAPIKFNNCDSPILILTKAMTRVRPKKKEEKNEFELKKKNDFDRNACSRIVFETKNKRIINSNYNFDIRKTSLYR